MKDIANEDDNGLVWPTIFSEKEFDKWIAEHKIELDPIIYKFVKMRDIFHLLNDLNKNYPRISGNLALLIGTAEFEIEIFKLIVDDRGNKDGFEYDILSILIQLFQRHGEKYGHFKESDKTWNDVLESEINVKKKET